MSYNNADIAACGHATCPNRETCLRWVIGQRMDDYQCFGLFVPKDGKCDFYWETNEKVTNENDNEEVSSHTH